MELFTGRDTREKGWFWLDDEYLNGYARHLGTTATCVYICLCRHVDKDQTCFPKLETIGHEIGVVKNSVITAIKKLEQFGIIEVRKEYDSEKKRQKVNIYLLKDKKFWLKIPEQGANFEPRAGCKKREKQGANFDKSRVQPLSCKGTHIKGTHIKEEDEQSSSEIPLIIKAFESINPACKNLYGNKTQRNACQDLIETYGFERSLTVIEKTLPRTNKLTADFFPNISTPLQLMEKWQKLEDAIFSYRKRTEKLPSKIAFS